MESNTEILNNKTKFEKKPNDGINPKTKLNNCNNTTKKIIADTLCCFGFNFQHGLAGLDKSISTAITLYTIAAEQGHTYALYYLACIYKQGEAGVAQDIDKAIEYFKLAADQGFADAQFNLGCIYEIGKLGIAKDVNKAKLYYSMAAEQGDMDAQFNLGSIYDSLGGESNNTKALQYYSLACLQGHKSALCNLKCMLMSQKEENFKENPPILNNYNQSSQASKNDSKYNISTKNINKKAKINKKKN